MYEQRNKRSFKSYYYEYNTSLAARKLENMGDQEKNIPIYGSKTVNCLAGEPKESHVLDWFK